MGQGTSSTRGSRRGRSSSAANMSVVNGNWKPEASSGEKLGRRKSFSMRWGHKPSLRSNGSTELSTTFSLNDSALSHQRLNVNTATEEELMTLPGIGRHVAKNLVEHRTAIGGFKKVEDLALVSGVGAANLDRIRPEICVGGRRWPNSGSSVYGGLSRNSSFDQTWSQPCSAEHTPRLQHRRRVTVDINSANVFTLMSLSGVGQMLAANIVHYREKRGPFRNVNEIAKVKGMNLRLLAEMLPYLRAGPDTSTARPPQSQSATPLSVRSLKGPRAGEEGTVVDGVRELFDMLSERSVRPSGIEDFAFERDGQTALRLATWNLSEMGAEKSNNLGVLEVIACTLLEQRISLVAVQEVGGSDVLEKVCAELNNPTFARVLGLGSSGLWKSVCSEPSRNTSDTRSRRRPERLGFIYDTARGIELVSSGLVGVPIPDNNNDVYGNGNFRANFRVDVRLELCLLNVHLRLPNENGFVTSRIHELNLQTSFLETLDGSNIDGDRLIVLGDFSMLRCEKYGRILKERGLNRVIPVGCCTNSDVLAKPRFYDNIWMTKQIEDAFTGRWCTVKTGLTHLAIPRGWQWGGVASEHCPIWAEFFVPEPLSEIKSNLVADGSDTTASIDGEL